MQETNKEAEHQMMNMNGQGRRSPAPEHEVTDGTSPCVYGTVRWLQAGLLPTLPGLTSCRHASNTVMTELDPLPAPACPTHISPDGPEYVSSVPATAFLMNPSKSRRASLVAPVPPTDQASEKRKSDSVWRRARVSSTLEYSASSWGGGERGTGEGK
jgi:hypothetical protein